MPKSAPRFSRMKKRAPDRRTHQPWRKWYSTGRWKSLARIVLRDEPLCRECKKQGRIEASAVVDHIKPHRGDYTLFFERDNLQGLCTECHNVKTGKGL